MNKLPMNITILKRTHSHDGAFIVITVQDSLSSKNFVKVKISLEDFAQAITGLASVPCQGEVHSLDLVGKKMTHKSFEFRMPEGSTYSNKRKEIAIETLEKECPKGWTPSDTFSSQDSFFTKDDEDWARGTIRSYTEPTEADLEEAKGKHI